MAPSAGRGGGGTGELALFSTTDGIEADQSARARQSQRGRRWSSSADGVILAYGRVRRDVIDRSRGFLASRFVLAPPARKMYNRYLSCP